MTEAQEALRDSIKAWEQKLDLAKAERYDEIVLRRRGCPLCQVFNVAVMDACVGCPVRERTGQPFCRGTPYSMAAFQLRTPGSTQSQIVEAIETEVEFLKSLENEQ